MEQSISNFAKKYFTFLEKVSDELKGQPASEFLLNFSIKLKNFSIENKLSTLIKSSEKNFYLESPADNFFLVTAGQAMNIIESGKNRFALIEKSLKKWHGKVISNLPEAELKNLPLFVGGMQFVAAENDPLWEDFPDSEWFVPELLITGINGEIYFIFNAIAVQKFSAQNLVDRFSLLLEKYLSLKQNADPKHMIKILSSEGNTPKEKKRWTTLVRDAVNSIHNKELDKVVLSRKIALSLSDKPNFDFIINQLKAKYPESFIFIYHIGKSFLLGASPERIAKLNGDILEIDSLAGSIRRGENPEEDSELESQLVESSKDMEEHRVVLHFILNAIKDHSVSAQQPDTQLIKKLYNIQHLWTPIKATLKPNSSIFKILEALYPSPAICGYPKTNAFNLIKKLEDYERGMYSGIIGWFNLHESAEFVAAIRSALYCNKKIYAFAGSGIVSDSEPANELLETELKLMTITSLFENDQKN